MNSTFKVVFNKARGALMVVNEVTSSVQAKGTKTVIAAAVASLVAGAAMAADGTIKNFGAGLGLDEGKAVIVKNEAFTKGDAANKVEIATKDNVVTATVTASKVKTDLNGTSKAWGAFTNAGAKSTGWFEANQYNVVLKDSTFTDNESTHAGAGATFWIDANASDHTVQNSTFSGNKGENKGGALATLQADAGHTDAGKLTVKDSTFEGNEVVGKTEAVKGGGAVYVESNLDVIGTTTFKGNKSSKDGGAIYVGTYGSTSLTVKLGVKDTDAVTFEGNVAAGHVDASKNVIAGHGGAVYSNGATITAKLVEYKNNEAKGNGGALYLNGGSYSQTGGTFEGNKATVVYDKDDNKISDSGIGGAIYTKNGANVTLNNVVAKGNTAANGGFIQANGGTHTFTNTTFTDNTAGGWGGAVRLAGGAKATFAVTEGKELVYSGNKAGTDAKEDAVKMYGAENLGGFMNLVGGSEATFDIAKNASLTIEDGFAASYSTKAGNNVASKVTKSGAGKLVVADMSAFVGDLNVAAGEMELQGQIGTFDNIAQSRANYYTGTTPDAAEGGIEANDVATTVTVGQTGENEAVKASLKMGDVEVNRTTNFTVQGAGKLTMDSLTLGSREYVDIYVQETGSTATLNAKSKKTTYGASTITGNVTVEGAVTVGNNTTLTNNGKMTVGSVNTAAAIEASTGVDAQAEGEISGAGSFVINGTADSVNAGSLTTATLTLKAGSFANTGSLTADTVVVEGGTLTNTATLTVGEVDVLKGATFTTNLADKSGATISIGTAEAPTTVKVKEGATLNIAALNGKLDATATEAADALVLKTDSYKIDGTLAVAGEKFTGKLVIDSANVEFGSDQEFAKLNVKSGALTVDSDVTVTEKFKNAVAVAGAGENLTAGVQVLDFSTLSLTSKAAGFKVVSGAASVEDIEKILNNGTVLISDGTAEFASLDKITQFSNSINATGSKGLVVLGKGATLKDADTALVSGSGSDAGTLKFDTANAMAGIVIDDFVNTVVSHVSETNTLAGGSFGAIMLDAGATSAGVTGGLTLNGNGTDGKLVTYTTTSGSTTTTHIGGLTLAPGAVLTTKVAGGEVGAIAGSGAIVNVAEGDLTVQGKLEAKELNVLGTGLDMGKDEDGDIYDMEVGALYAFGDVNAGNLSLKGTDPGNNESEIGATVTAKVVDIDNGHTVLVGTDEEGYSTAGKLVADEITGSGVIFADPAWKDGNVLPLDETSQVLAGTITADTKLIAGQGSIVTIGTTDDAAAIQALRAAGYNQLGANEGQVKSVVYVEGGKKYDEASDTFNYTKVAGHVIANGWTSAEYDARTTDPENVQIAAGNLMIVNMDTVDTEAGTGNEVFAKTVKNDGTIYLANAELGDKIRFSAVDDGYTGEGEILFNGDRLMSAVLKDDVHTICFDDDKLIHYEALETLPLVMAMYEEGAQNGASKSAQFNSWLMSSNNGLEREEVIAAGNDVASIVGTAGMANVTMDALSQFNDTVATRTSVLAKNGEGINVWADVNGGKFEGKKIMDGQGYSSDIYAGVIGVDTTVACGAKIGAALTVGTADTDSQNTTAKSSMDSDLFGVSIYTAKQFGDFNVAADIGYMQASNDVNVQAYNLGKFSADSDAFTIGVRGELLAKAGSLDIVPHVGLRWTRLSIDNFEAGYTTDIENMNVFQMPIGVTVSGEIEASGWTIAPAFDLSVIPTWGDKDIEATLGIGGVSLKEEGSMRVLDSNVVNATLGVAAQNGAWTFGLDYKLGVGSDDRLNNSFNARVNYAF